MKRDNVLPPRLTPLLLGLLLDLLSQQELRLNRLDLGLLLDLLSQQELRPNRLVLDLLLALSYALLLHIHQHHPLAPGDAALRLKKYTTNY